MIPSGPLRHWSLCVLSDFFLFVPVWYVETYTYSPVTYCRLGTLNGLPLRIQFIPL